MGPMQETDTTNRDAGGPLPRQWTWCEQLERLVMNRVADWLEEDLGRECDWTSLATVASSAVATATVVTRGGGRVAGLPAAAVAAVRVDPQLRFSTLVEDGTDVGRGEAVAEISGPVRSILTAERTILNVLGRLSGVATATARLVALVGNGPSRVFDTRKTVPGWRLLDKYAVRMGGGWNHRTGLFDAILIKDNHLAALLAEAVDRPGGASHGPGMAVRRARDFVVRTFPPARAGAMIIEVEVDSLDQLADALPAAPDVVLLDNMEPTNLVKAVAMRNAVAPAVVLEASGGVGPDTSASIAASGVDRISSGWPTHHAPWLDLGLDWGGKSTE
ncbi:MAG: carboxylating nicotinate-nucleotide diphosphorylase [Planctomycetaceae bacterium]